MKQTLFVLLCAAWTLAAIEPVFHCDFDNTLTPRRGSGAPATETPAEYRPGLRGQALLVGTDEKGVRRGVSYPHQGNLDWEQGTISFWVKPLNWNGDDIGFFHMLFTARAGENLFYIYKYHEGERLYFLRGKHGFWLFAKYAPGEWRKGEWHHVACSWDKVQSAIHIDGQRVTTRRIVFPLKDLTPKSASTLGENKSSMRHKSGRLSLMDEFKIFNRMLSDAEIFELYRRDAARAAAPVKNLITAGPGERSVFFPAFTFRNTDRLAPASRQKPFALGWLPGKLIVQAPESTLELLAPSGKKHLFKLKNGRNELNLAPIGLRPGVKGWTMNLVADGLETGPARLVLDETIPPVAIDGFTDPETKNLRLTMGAMPDFEARLIRDTTHDYGYRRSRHALERNLRTADFAFDDLLRVSCELARNGQTVFRKDFSLLPERKISLMFLYTLIDRKMLRVALRGQAAGEIRLSLMDRHNHAVQSRTVKLPDNAPYFFELDIPIEFVPGDYTVRIEHLENGKTTLAGTRKLRIPPAADPLTAPCKAARADTLPPGGWTPVQATDGGRIELWGRDFQFGGVLFQSLRSQGRELLADPIRLELNGQAVSGKSTVRVLKHDQLAATCRNDFSAETFDVSSEVKIHFDGYAEVAMTFTPRHPATVRELALVLPMPRERAVLLRDGNALSTIAGKIKAPVHFSLLAPVPTFWIGDYRTGINFTAETLQNWHYRGDRKHVAVNPDGKTVQVKLLLASAPFRLDKPMTICFGLTPTPAKPLNRALLRQRIGRDWQMWFQPWSDFNVLDPRRIFEEPPYRGMNYYHRTCAGFKELFFYSAYNFMGPFAPEWTFYEELWRQVKHNRGYGTWTAGSDTYCEGCINGESYRNFRLNNWYNFINMPGNPMLKPGTRNFYFDAPWETGCWNEKHGCRLWRDNLGMKHPPLLVNRFREMAIAVYRMIKGQGPDAKLSYHAEWNKILPHQTFSDVLAGGEGQENQVAGHGGYYDILTPSAFAATFSPYIYAAKTALIPQLRRGLLLNYPQKYKNFSPDKPEFRRAILHYIGLCALHDTDLWDGDKDLVKTWRDAQDELGWDERTVFHPYYDERPAIRVTPVSERIPASGYTHSGKLMVAVLNDTDQEREVTLHFDLNKLGVKPGLRGRDVFAPAERWTLANEWHGKIAPRGFKLLLFR